VLVAYYVSALANSSPLNHPYSALCTKNEKMKSLSGCSVVTYSTRGMYWNQLRNINCSHYLYIAAVMYVQCVWKPIVDS